MYTHIYLEKDFACRYIVHSGGGGTLYVCIYFLYRIKRTHVVYTIQISFHIGIVLFSYVTGKANQTRMLVYESPDLSNIYVLESTFSQI